MKVAEGNGQLLQLVTPCVLPFLEPVPVSRCVPGEQGRAMVFNQSWPWEYNPPQPLLGQEDQHQHSLQPTGPRHSATILLPPPCSCTAPHHGPVMGQFILWESTKVARVSTGTIETQLTLLLLAS